MVIGIDAVDVPYMSEFPAMVGDPAAFVGCPDSPSRGGNTPPRGDRRLVGSGTNVEIETFSTTAARHRISTGIRCRPLSRLAYEARGTPMNFASSACVISRRLRANCNSRPCGPQKFSQA
jgi:hypothetical protein